VCVGAPAAAHENVPRRRNHFHTSQSPRCCDWPRRHSRAPSELRGAAVCAAHQPQRVGMASCIELSIEGPRPVPIAHPHITNRPAPKGRKIIAQGKGAKRLPPWVPTPHILFSLSSRWGRRGPGRGGPSTARIMEERPGDRISPNVQPASKLQNRKPGPLIMEKFHFHGCARIFRNLEP
jgi:hypothetical protein